LCLIVISWLIVGLLFSYVALSPSFLRRPLSPQLPSLSHRHCRCSHHCHHHCIATVPAAFVAVLPHCRCPATLLLSCHQVDCCIAVISLPSCCHHSRHHRYVVILVDFLSLLLSCCCCCCLAIAVPTTASSQLPPHLGCCIAVVSSRSFLRCRIIAVAIASLSPQSPSPSPSCCCCPH